MKVLSPGPRMILSVFVFCMCSASAQISMAPKASAAQRVRTYYVAADEVAWDYAPSGRDEAMGHPFDDFEKN